MVRRHSGHIRNLPCRPAIIAPCSSLYLMVAGSITSCIQLVILLRTWQIWRLVCEIAVLQRPRRTDPCSQMTARDGPCGSKAFLWFEGIRNAFATFPDSTTIVEFALSDGEQLVILLRTWQVHWRLVREVAVLQRPRRTDPCSQMTARDGPCGSKAFDTHS